MQYIIKYYTFDHPFSQNKKRMSPRTKEQFKAIRKEKEEVIMQTALRLFASKGFEATSVSIIAKEAGISKGLMYNYFKSKEDLLKRVIIGNLSKFLDYLQIENPESIQKEEIIQFIDGNLQQLKKEPDFFKLYFSLAFQPSVFSLLEEDIMQVFMPLVEVFTNYYAQSGEEQPFVKARFLLAIFDGIGIHYVMDTQSFPLDETHDLIINLL